MIGFFFLQPIDISVIQDKFPENKGGLKEHYDRCPPNSFFMVKVWVSTRTQSHQGQIHVYCENDPNGRFLCFVGRYELSGNQS